jgi:glc operon protein GlcG
VIGEYDHATGCRAGINVLNNKPHFKEEPMDATELKNRIDRIIQSAGKLLPAFLADPADEGISGGNVSLCIVDLNGQVHGAMWGNDKIKQRYTFQTAWRKASQVWITGIATGQYEELVYSKQIDPFQHGIQKPDLIGWEGGWPVKFGGGLQLAVAVSGMRGGKDTELVEKAVSAAGGTTGSN